MKIPGSFTQTLHEKIDTALSTDPKATLLASELKPLVDKAQEEVTSLYEALDRLPKSWVHYINAGDGEQDTPDERLIKLLGWAARRLPHSVREYLAEVEPKVDISD